MTASETITRADTLTDVTDETGEASWEKVARLRKELELTQAQLADMVGLTEETVSNVERGPGKRGERPSTQTLLDALEAERRRRASSRPADRGPDILEVLARHRAEDVRVRRIGSKRKVRWFQFGIPDEDATPEEIAAALEEWHQQQRHDDPRG
jgi:transcriptional regulator with XRE-family HTH domain